MTHADAEAGRPGRLYPGLALEAEEDTCRIRTDDGVLTVGYAAQFPGPRRERVLPGHLVLVAESPGARIVVWRWYDAVVTGIGTDTVQLWEPAHGTNAARRRDPRRHYELGTRAYLSAGLPGADWWVAGPVTSQPGAAEVEIDEVARLYTEGGLWAAAFG